MFSGITITCFAASYATALLLEVTRLFFRAPVRLAVIVAFAVAGLAAQTMYLWGLAQDEAAGKVLFASWYDWCLLAAWTLAAIYVFLTLRYPRTPVGIFLLPVTLLLIGTAYLARQAPPFPRGQTLVVWGAAHGVALLVGVVVVALGFVAGLMYLAQSYRLRRKLPPRPGFRLPSLEALQAVNRQALVFSWIFIVAGLGAGAIFNLVKQWNGGGGAVPWTDRVIVMSGVLLAWVIVGAIFEVVYKPARQGQKVAYLTIFSFVIMGLTLLIVLFGESRHARAAAKRAAQIDAPAGFTPAETGFCTTWRNRLEANVFAPAGFTPAEAGFCTTWRNRLEANVFAPAGFTPAEAGFCTTSRKRLEANVFVPAGFTPAETGFCTMGGAARRYSGGVGTPLGMAAASFVVQKSTSAGASPAGRKKIATLQVLAVVQKPTSAGAGPAGRAVDVARIDIAAAAAPESQGAT